MTKKYDIRSDPKFMKRVAKIEGNQYTKVLKNPLRVTIGEVDWFVACIGLNDAYMIVRPIVRDEDGKFTGFDALWTKNDGFNTPNAYHDKVSTTVLNWMMLHADDTCFVKRKHGDIKITEQATECCSKIVGQEIMSKAGETFDSCWVQSTLREHIVRNPYHR